MPYLGFWQPGKPLFSGEGISSTTNKNEQHVKQDKCFELKLQYDADGRLVLLQKILDAPDKKYVDQSYEFSDYVLLNKGFWYPRVVKLTRYLPNSRGMKDGYFLDFVTTYHAELADCNPFASGLFQRPTPAERGCNTRLSSYER